MQAKSPRLQAAIRYAEAGIPIFPCLPDLKKPATAHGFKDATTDLAQIEAWWAEADYNLAFSPAEVGWGIVDPDGPEGAAALDALELEHGKLPETFEVATPRGGRHIYFDGVLPTTAWAPGRKRCLGEHIDTRGDGSYALLPPSTFEGKPYVVSKDFNVASLPEWISGRLSRADQRVTATETGLDSLPILARARTFLGDLVKRGDIAIEGQAGNSRTYQLACEILNLGVSADQAQALIAEIWNPHCIPPWPEDELSVIIENASTYAQNDVGAWAGPPASEVFKAALDKLPSLPVQAPKLSRFHPYSVEEQEEGDDDDDQAWMFKDLMPDASTVLLTGSKGSFKSFISHHLGLSIASGIPTLGMTPMRAGPFFYGTHEGFRDMKKRRRRAWELVHQPVKGYPFFLMHAPHLINSEEVEEFREQIRIILRKSSVKIGGIALDTLAKCMFGLDENSVGDTGRFVDFCDSLVTEFECPVIVDHHKPKDGRAVGRGSGNIEAGFSTVLDIERPDQGRAVALRVRYHKDAEEPSEPWTFEAQRILASIVFQPTTPTEHSNMLHAADLYDARKVGTALAGLGAYGAENAVSTYILAGEIAPPPENLGEDERLAFINRTARTLTGLGRLRGKLEGYCQRVGREMLWSLPEPEAKPGLDPDN